jgi:predicted lipoprotein with Yx(FWY)xxD motif
MLGLLACSPAFFIRPQGETMNLTRNFYAFAAALLLSAYASIGMAQMPAGVKAADGVLTNSAGMTLYTFDKDAGGKSACNGPCAGNWPPLMATGDVKAMGDWTIITRDDGGKQWAYKGMPLYTWVKDTRPGDKTGDGFANGAWHVAKP